MPRKKPGISTSDRDVLRDVLKHRSSMDATADVDDSDDDTIIGDPPPNARIPDLGETTESFSRFINAVARALIDGYIDEKKADSLTAMHRSAITNLKHRDAKQEDAELEDMLRRSENVNAAGLQHEAGERHHVSKAVEPEADADGDDGDE